MERGAPLGRRRWKDEAGKVFLSLKPGGQLIEIAPGKRSIEIGSAEDLPAQIDVLCQAVRAGELDACAGSGPARPVRAKKPDGNPVGKVGLGSECLGSSLTHVETPSSRKWTFVSVQCSRPLSAQL